MMGLGPGDTLAERGGGVEAPRLHGGGRVRMPAFVRFPAIAPEARRTAPWRSATRSRTAGPRAASFLGGALARAREGLCGIEARRGTDVAPPRRGRVRPQRGKERHE